jgi:hypothetical protein
MLTFPSTQSDPVGEVLTDLRDIELPMHYYKYSMAAYVSFSQVLKH